MWEHHTGTQEWKQFIVNPLTVSSMIWPGLSSIYRCPHFVQLQRFILKHKTKQELEGQEYSDLLKLGI
jgi:hypothetical protein